MATRHTTVRVFESAVRKLADDQSDPVVNVLEGAADDIRTAALSNIDRIFKGRNPGVDLVIETGKDSKGLFVRVRPDGGGRLSSYLTFKEFREHSWLAPAVAEVVGASGVRSPSGRAAGTISRLLAQVGPRA